MDKKIGTILKKLRKNSGMSVSEVLVKLKELGQEIQQPTLYAYENNTRAANADMFIALCQIYGCNNVLETFAGIEVDYSIPDDNEWKMIEKYRFISENSPDGAKTVDYILNREHHVAEQLKEWKDSGASHMEEDEEIIYLPELYSRFSAGTGQYSSDSGYEMTKVPHTPLTVQATSIATISGDSMEPEYQNGDRVLVKATPDIEFGDIGVWAVNNELYIKAKGDGELVSLNPDYDNIIIGENDNVYCIGQVIGKLN